MQLLWALKYIRYERPTLPLRRKNGNFHPKHSEMAFETVLTKCTFAILRFILKCETNSMTASVPASMLRSCYAPCSLKTAKLGNRLSSLKLHKPLYIHQQLCLSLISLFQCMETSIFIWFTIMLIPHFRAYSSTEKNEKQKRRIEHGKIF